MQIFRSRPLAAAAVAAMASALILFVGTATLGRIVCLLALLLFVLILPLFLFVRHKPIWLIRNETVLLTLLLTAVTVCLTTAQSLYFFHGRTVIPSELIDSETECMIEGSVEEVNSGAGYSSCVLSLCTIAGKPVKGKAALFCDEQVTLQAGDMIRAQVTLQSPQNYYETESLYYALADGIRICLICGSDPNIELIGTNARPLKDLFSQWRANLSARLLSLTGKQRGGLAIALFLGDRDGLDVSVSTNFRRVGVSHLLALSGMHVTVLMGMLAAFTTRIGISQRGRLLILSIPALVYLALTGFRLSAVRATGMLLLYYCASFIGSRHDPLTTLAIIGWSIITLSPFSVADCGFWMSFLAMFGLVTVLPTFNEWLISSSIPTRFHAPLQGIMASVIAVVAVSYCSWLFSGQIAPIGILLTVVMAPILTLVLTLIPLVLLLDILPFLSAVPLALPLSWALEIMIDLTEYLSNLRNIVFSLQFPYAGLILFIMLGVLLLMLILPLKRSRYLLIPPLLTAVVLVIYSNTWLDAQFQEQIHLDYVARSSGSALVITDREGAAIIDTSSGSFSMLRDTERVLASQHTTEIEHLILTHYHRAYTYSAERFAKRWKIRYLWVPAPQSETEYLHLSALSERLTPLGTSIRCYTVGDEIDLFGEATFEVIDASYLDRSTQPILTYSLQTSQEKLIFTSPVVMESDFYSTFRCVYQEADILILGKHGPNAKQPFLFPDGESDPDLILIDTSALLPYLDLSPQSKAYNLHMLVDIERYTFEMPK